MRAYARAMETKMTKMVMANKMKKVKKIRRYKKKAIRRESAKCH